MAINIPLEEVSTRHIEMAAGEDSNEMQADSIPREDSQEKAEFTTEQDYELVVIDALEKIDINSKA